MLINRRAGALALYLRNSLGILSYLDDKCMVFLIKLIIQYQTVAPLSHSISKLLYLCFVVSLFFLSYSWADGTKEHFFELSPKIFVDYPSPVMIVVIIIKNG